MKKRILPVVIALSTVITSVSLVGAATGSSSQGKTVSPTLTTEQQKRKQGYTKKTTLGIEYKRTETIWSKYDDNVDTEGLDDDPTPSSPLFDARYVGYLSNEGLEDYEAALKITDSKKKQDTINEVLSHEKLVYSIVVFKKTPSAADIKKNVKGQNVVKIGESQGYSFYFGYDNYNDSDLKSQASKDGFKALYNDAKIIKSSMTVFKPVSSEEGIKNTKKFSFNLSDVYGKKVSDSIFKQNKLTLVNIWGTYCGPCKRELPTLQQLSVDLKSKKVGFLGIVSDTYTSTGIDKKLVETAKSILATAKVTYPNILPDETLKYDGVLSYVSAIPTTFFVDSNGNIVGDVRIGDGTKDDYTKIINSLLTKLSSK